MGDEFDYNSFVAEFDESYEEPTSEEVEETEVEEPQVDEVETEDNQDDVEEAETEVEDEETQEETQETFKDDRQNKAFAELRRKATENERAAVALKKFAEQAGVSEEEVIARFEQKALEQEAQRQGVDPEVLKRIKALEAENETIKTQTVAEKMNAQIEATIQKYGATDEDIKATFEEMARSGVDPRLNPNVDFERFYKAANFDKILEKKVSEAKQTSLAQKKKRQEQAAIPNGTSTTQTGTDIDDLVDKDVKDILENW